MWVIFTALLAASLNPQSQASVTFASTCWVKGQPAEELILLCGDGEHGGEEDSRKAVLLNVSTGF